jgi:hypothetical protein
VTDRQPKIGATRTDAQGRTWRKVRVLSDEEWRNALVAADFAIRVGTLSDGHVGAMGYALVRTSRADEAPSRAVIP